ncbi:hypothetical protein BCR39DRAFT_591825, partial [Naematelia encephala]
MLFFSLLLSLFSLSPLALAVPSVNSTTYFNGLTTALLTLGLNECVNVLSAVNTTIAGQQLLNSLYTGDTFTLYAPVDTAWDASGLANIQPSGDLVSLLEYHIVTAQINSTTDIAFSRHHTIAITKLNTPTVRLPENQPQVIVLEQAPNNTFILPNTTISIPPYTTSNPPPILIRGDQWNATSVAPQAIYQNLYIQPISRVLSVPSPLLKTLLLPGLSISAPTGATSFNDLLSQLNLSAALANCDGCTFFVPVNAAIDAVSSTFSAMTADQQNAVLLNHLIDGVLLNTDSDPDIDATTAQGQNTLSGITGTFATSTPTSSSISTSTTQTITSGQGSGNQNQPSQGHTQPS